MNNKKGFEIPLVSVKMLAYNHEGLIGEAIESVLAQQTDFPFELIIGEDCSTDNTLEVARSYQKKYPNIIHVITSDENIGSKKNGSRIRAACRGKYQAICEGDDYWIDPLKLQKQIAVMRSDPSIKLCFHNVYFEYQNPVRRKAMSSRFRKSGYQKIKDVIIQGGKFYKLVSAMVDCSIYDSMPEWYVDAPVGDWPLGLKSALEGRIYYLDEIMAVYRADVSESWSQRMYAHADDYKRHMFQSMDVRKKVDSITEHRYKKYFRKRIGRDLMWLLLYINLSREEFLKIWNDYFEYLSNIRKILFLLLRHLNVQFHFQKFRELVKAILRKSP